MGYSNGQVQSSSDSGKAHKGDPGLPGIGFNLTDDGNFDLDGKRLTDVADPTDNGDAVTKGYVDTKNSQQNIAINSKAEKAYVDSENYKQDIAINGKAEKTDVLLLDGTQTMGANFDMNSYKIYNLANGTSDGDVVNFSQLKTHTDSHLNNFHLQKSFTFFKNFGDQAQLTKSNLSPFSGHNHHGLYRIQKEGSDPGFNGQAWVSLKMTNYLAVGIYTVVFETFSGTSFLSPANINQLNNETLLQQVRGDANFRIITSSHDYQTVGASKSLYLPISGIRGMQGNLSMGGQSIVNLRPFVEIDSAQPAQDNEVINFGYFHTQKGDLKRLINEVAYDALNRKNPDPMQDPIDMGNNFITHVKDPLPSNSHYVVTVNFVNKTVSDNNATISTSIDSKINEVEDLNITSAKQDNVFSFILEDDLFKEDDSDITKVGKVNKDFYDIDKETYQFNISYDGNIGYYSTRLGIDLKPLDLGEYTFVFEMYYDKNKVNKELVVVARYEKSDLL